MQFLAHNLLIFLEKKQRDKIGKEGERIVQPL